MPKVTIFSRNGQVTEKMECVEIEPYNGSFKRIVIRKPDQITLSGGHSIMTNLAFWVDGAERKGRHPEAYDIMNTIKLISDDGSLIHEWKKAQCLSFSSDILTFKVGETWHTITGTIMVVPAESRD